MIVSSCTRALKIQQIDQKEDSAYLLVVADMLTPNLLLFFVGTLGSPRRH